MRLRDGLIAGRSHLFFILLLIGLFFLLQWLDKLDTSQNASQDARASAGASDPIPTE